MKWVKKALAVTLAAMLVLPSIGAMADEADATAISEAAEQQPAAVPDVSGEDGKKDSETVSGNGAAGEETTANEMKTEAVENPEPAEEVQPDTLAETQPETEPVSGNQTDPAKVVRYNTGNCVMGVTDEETLNAMGSAFGELYADLEEDAEAPDAFPEFPDVKTWNWGVFEGGSYTINIPEENPFFPYEVQFTYQGNTWSEWFMSPEDTVEVGGKTFAVDCTEEITYMNLEVAGDTVVVYPERKEFTNDGGGISTMSLLPLETRSLTVDLTGYTPVELTMMKMDGQFSDGPEGATKIAWCNRNYSDYDRYVVSGLNEGIDLSWGTSYGGNTSWEMFVGDGDPLNASNIHYKVSVTTTSSQNWLTPTIYAQDSQGNRSAVEVSSVGYYDYYSESLSFAGVELYKRYLSASVFSGAVENKDRYLALSADVTAETFANTNVDRLEIFKGYHTTAAEAEASENITDQVMEDNMSAVSAGYKTENNYRADSFTMIAYNAKGDVIGCLPFDWAMSTTSDRLYVKLNGTSQNIYYEGQNVTFNNVSVGSHPLTMEYQRGTGSNCPEVEAVYVGQYDSIAEAGSEKNIKDLVFGTDATGYSADFSDGIAFTVFFGKDDNSNQKIYTFTIKTVKPVEPKPSDSLSVKLNGTTRYIFYKGQDVTFYDVPTGSYPLVMEYQKVAGSDCPEVEAVYVGEYDSIAAADGQSNIKDKVFGEDAKGYSADFSDGVAFTVFFGKDDNSNQKIYTFTVKTVEPPKSGNSLMEFTGGLQDEDGNWVTAYKIEDTDDSYGDKNFITFLVDAQLDLETKRFAPLYNCSDKANVFTSEGPDESGKVHSFADGAVQYSVSSEDGNNRKEYWVQIKNAPSEFGKLYISSLIHKDSETYVGKEDGVTYSKREVMLDSYHNYVHDICFANMDAAPLEKLSAELTSDVLELDPYWTLNGEQALQGLSTVERPAYDSGKEGELPNLAKVRLHAKAGVAEGTDVTGTLTIKSGDTVLMVLELTGVVGDPCILTEKIPDAVKYVPYSAIIQTSNKYSWIKVSYEVRYGRLPEGVEIKPNGELYGVPQETGSFTFTIEADFINTRGEVINFQPQYATFTLNVNENSNANVYNESDDSYKLITPVGVETSAGSYDFYLEEIVESEFVSEGEFGDFMDLWLNGEKLVKDDDYTAESGSTVITIKAQTLQNKAAKSGNNTIAAEFREGGDLNNTLHRTAQNFHLDKNTSPDDNGSGSGNNGSGSGSDNNGNGSGSGNNGNGSGSDNNGNGSGSGNNGNGSGSGNNGNGSGSGNNGSGSGSGNNGSGSGSSSEGNGNGVTIAGCILDANGNHLSGVTVELHSTPRSTVTDGNGFFRFANVEYGQHELFVKDQAGNIMASQKFEVTEGSNVALNGFVLTVPKGGTIPLAVKVANGALTFSTTGNAADAAAQAAAAYAESAATGDDENPVGWLLALLISGCMAAGVVVYHRRKARIS